MVQLGFSAQEKYLPKFYGDLAKHYRYLNTKKQRLNNN